MGSGWKPVGKRNTDPLPEEVDLLQREVQECRRTKVGPGAPMPYEIWETAVRLAREFGVCRIARATGLDYVWLRKKLERRPAPATGPTFVEMPIEMMAEAGSDSGKMLGGPDRGNPGTIVEVAGPDGSRMRTQRGAGTFGLGPAPVAQGRIVEPFSAQHCAHLAGAFAGISLGQDPQLVHQR